MRKSVRSLILGVVAATLWLPGSANAATDMGLFMDSIGVPNSNVLYFGWDPIVAPTATSELADLSVLNFGLAMYEVGGQLRFTFVNGQTTPLTASVITGIYFDDGSATESGAFFNTGTVVADSGSGVNFTLGNIGNPDWNLPEGSNVSPTFDTTDGISWERANAGGGAVNGVDALPEYLTVGYTYTSPTIFNDIVSTFLNGTIRIGMHVQSIGSGAWSESVLWTPYTGDTPPGPGPLDPNPVVPVPAAAGLGMLGMAIVGMLRRKKSGARA